MKNEFTTEELKARIAQLELENLRLKDSGVKDSDDDSSIEPSIVDLSDAYDLLSDVSDLVDLFEDEQNISISTITTITNCVKNVAEQAKVVADDLANSVPQDGLDLADLKDLLSDIQDLPEMLEGTVSVLKNYVESLAEGAKTVGSSLRKTDSDYTEDTDEEIQLTGNPIVDLLMGISNPVQMEKQLRKKTVEGLKSAYEIHKQNITGVVVCKCGKSDCIGQVPRSLLVARLGSILKCIESNLFGAGRTEMILEAMALSSVLRTVH